MIKRILFILICLLALYASASAQSSPTLTIKETDGSPKVVFPSELIFPAGSLTRNGQKVTISFGGGGGGGAVDSVFGRTGVVVSATNDYTWAQINKATSSLADITTRSASDLSSGTLPDARFPATLPVLSGANLTALNASSLGSGTVPDARFPATLPALSGVNLTALNASALGSGTVPDARFPATLPAISGVNLTNLNGSNVSSGTVADARIASALTGKTYNGLTLDATTGIFHLANGKTLTVSNSLTLTGTDGTSHVFPSTSSTLARTDTDQTFGGTQSFTGVILASDSGIARSSATTTGLYFGPEYVVFQAAAEAQFFFERSTQRQFVLGSSIKFGWASTTSAIGSVIDTAFERAAAGTVKLTDGSTGFGKLTLGTSVYDLAGSGSPEGAVTANIGSIYRRTNGSTGTAVYFKESGTGNTGWTAIGAGGGGGVSASSTDTFTNKTVDAEGTGNVLTIPVPVEFLAAGCNAGLASTFLNLPSSNAPAAACQTGTNSLDASLDYNDSTNQSAQGNLKLPDDWSGAVDFDLQWFAAATSGNVIWALQTGCAADGEVGDPSWNTAQTVTDAAKGTTLQLNNAAISSVTTTGCAAGETLYWKLYRDAAAGGDTMTGDARLRSARFKMRRAM
jgi:hypothetical protein